MTARFVRFADLGHPDDDVFEHRGVELVVDEFPLACVAYQVGFTKYRQVS